MAGTGDCKVSPDRTPQQHCAEMQSRRLVVSHGRRGWTRECRGSGHRGPPPRRAGCVGRNRLVVRTVGPLIPPAGTFSPHGVEKDPIQASARPADGSFPSTPQRRQPRVPPLPRIDSRQTQPPRPRERAGVRAKSPLFSCGLSRVLDLSLHSLLLYSLGLRPRGEGERAALFVRSLPRLGSLTPLSLALLSRPPAAG